MCYATPENRVDERGWCCWGSRYLAFGHGTFKHAKQSSLDSSQTHKHAGGVSLKLILHIFSSVLLFLFFFFLGGGGGVV